MNVIVFLQDLNGQILSKCPAVMWPCQWSMHFIMWWGPSSSKVIFLSFPQDSMVVASMLEATNTNFEWWIKGNCIRVMNGLKSMAAWQPFNLQHGRTPHKTYGWVLGLRTWPVNQDVITSQFLPWTFYKTLKAESHPNFQNWCGHTSVACASSCGGDEVTEASAK